MTEIIALQEYTDKYISLYQGEIRNIVDDLANQLINKGIVAEHHDIPIDDDNDDNYSKREIIELKPAIYNETDDEITYGLVYKDYDKQNDEIQTHYVSPAILSDFYDEGKIVVYTSLINIGAVYFFPYTDFLHLSYEGGQFRIVTEEDTFFADSYTNFFLSTTSKQPPK